MNRSSSNNLIFIIGAYLRAFGPLALGALIILTVLFYFTYLMTTLPPSITSGIYLFTHAISIVLFQIIKKANENNKPISHLSIAQVIVLIINAYLYVVCSTFLPWIINLIAVILIFLSMIIINAYIRKIEIPNEVYKIKNFLTYSIIIYILYFFITNTFVK